MAAFSEDDFGRLDLQLLQNSPVTLYFRAEVLAADIEELKKYGYAIDSFDCTTWENTVQMFAQIAAGLSFPDYPRHSFDGFNDLLSDFEIPGTGRALVFNRFDDFSKRHAVDAHVLLDILIRNSHYRMLFGERFFVLAQSDDPEISYKNLNAASAIWNPAERLNSARGL